MSMNEFRRLAAKIDQHMQQLAAQGVSEAHAIVDRMMGWCGARRSASGARLPSGLRRGPCLNREKAVNHNELNAETMAYTIYPDHPLGDENYAGWADARKPNVQRRWWASQTQPNLRTTFAGLNTERRNIQPPSRIFSMRDAAPVAVTVRV